MDVEESWDLGEGVREGDVCGGGLGPGGVEGVDVEEGWGRGVGEVSWC